MFTACTKCLASLGGARLMLCLLLLELDSTQRIIWRSKVDHPISCGCWNLTPKALKSSVCVIEANNFITRMELLSSLLSLLRIERVSIIGLLTNPRSLTVVGFVSHVIVDK